MATRWLSGQDLHGLLGTLPLQFPAYQDLADRIRYLVVDGRLVHDVRLPSERELASTLGISRATVAGAYARLADLGFLVPRRGAGNFVRAGPTTRGNGLVGPYPDFTDLVNLAFASPPAPAGLDEVYRSALDELPAVLGGHGYGPQGLVSLREQVAAWYGERGLPTAPDQIVVTNGAQSALNVVAGTLLRTGDRVLVEAPSYPNALDALRRSGARLVAYPLPEDGWQVSGYATTVRQTAPRLAHLIPEFHNPTGHWLDEEARPELAAALRRTRTTAVVDETLVELRLDGQHPRRPLAAWLPDALTLGSASKAFWGGLRIGWIRAPRVLIRSLVQTRALLDLGSPALEQLVVARLLAGSGVDVEEQRSRARMQRDHLVGLLTRRLPDWRVPTPGGGFTLWVGLPGETSSRLAAAAERHDLLLSAGPRFFPDGGGERHLRLPFTAPRQHLEEAVERLARAWADVGVSSPRPGTRRPWDLSV
ncbi:MocR-like transcription factor YczR [Microlunatus flavus]|uniref:DNA-binding transcriptional regulator, MocR family, contains an aminotransferase domain n=1 Tax=Microlunatus flavus TaxID=1036181 RepID=A0A1H9L942_9ACTN|nr:PLP-dependent aminotransferase family protein [Microlunatus flavus]SER07818.1 DNA-binding transcriptional regulator, MocR family, contains an aminotransferase domain [Microlunatus flavus]